MTVLSVTDTDYLPLPGSPEVLEVLDTLSTSGISPRLLPQPDDRCFCCERLLNGSVSVLGEDLFMCIPCDRELRRRRAYWLQAESALDAGGRP